MSETLILTGASGFIGSALRKKLSGKMQVFCIDITEPEHTYANEKWSILDVTDKDQLNSWFLQQKKDLPSIKTVIHLAWYYDFSNIVNPQYQRFIDGLRCLLDLTEKHLTEEVRFIYSGSMAALPQTRPGIKLDEKTSLQSSWQYPTSKHEASEVLKKSKIRNQVVELVFAGVYSDACELVPLFNYIENFRKRKFLRFFFPGDPKHGLTYVHLSDACDAIIATMQAQNLVGAGQHTRIFIAEEKPVSYHHIAKTTTSLLHQSFLLVTVPKFVALIGAFFLYLIEKNGFLKPWMIQYADEHYEMDVSKAKQLIGWKPFRSLKSCLPSMLEIARDRPQDWLRANEKRPWRYRN